MVGPALQGVGVAGEAAHIGKEVGGAAVPDGGVPLPQVLPAAGGDVFELGAHGLHGHPQSVVFNGVQHGGTPRMFGFAAGKGRARPPASAACVPSIPQRRGEIQRRGTETFGGGRKKPGKYPGKPAESPDVLAKIHLTTTGGSCII